MRFKIFIIVACCIGILTAGCATYTPSMVRLDTFGPDSVTMDNGDLSLQVEEYATPAKSERAFDTKLSEEGVLPLFIQVQNNSAKIYELKSMDIVVTDGSIPLKALAPAEAAGKAKRNAVTRALGWSLIVPIISIPVAVVASAAHTHSINKQIVEDFSAKSFQDGVIMPNKDRSGFLFFELGKDRKDLSGLSIEVTARNGDAGDVTKIVAALPQAAFRQNEQTDSRAVSSSSQ